MKITHLCIASFFPDNYAYQENLLPKYHKIMGYDVSVIAGLVTFNEKGKFTYLKGPQRYLNEYGIPVSRLKLKGDRTIYKKLKWYLGLYDELIAEKPDVIFMHGCQFIGIKSVIKYLKLYPDTKVYIDNHADFVNSAKGWVSKNILHKILWKTCAKMILPYTEKFYGVLPARVDFLTDVYGLPKDKCELLVMGTDVEKVEEALKPKIRAKKKEEYCIKDGDFVIMTGGKIDYNKPQTLKLMEAVNKMNLPNVKLLVFGSVISSLKNEFDKQLSDNVKYIGWKKSNDIYKEFAVADLVVFPGLHSVLWEQAVGMGKPCIFKKIKGFDHIDLDGNCLFFEEDSIDSYQDVLKNAIENIEDLTKIAKEKGPKHFSYVNIAKRSIER